MAHLSSGGGTACEIPADYTRIPEAKKAGEAGGAMKKQWESLGKIPGTGHGRSLQNRPQRRQPGRVISSVDLERALNYMI